MQHTTCSLLFEGLRPCCYRHLRDNYDTSYTLSLFADIGPRCYHDLCDNYNTTYNLFTFAGRPAAFLLWYCHLRDNYNTNYTC